MLRSVNFIAFTSLVLIAGQAEACAQVLPSNPSSGDLKVLLVQASKGVVNPHEVIVTLSRSDGRYVSIMRELLFDERSHSGAQSKQSEDSVQSRHVPMPGYMILVKSLENVGSSECLLLSPGRCGEAS